MPDDRHHTAPHDNHDMLADEQALEELFANREDDEGQGEEDGYEWTHR